MRLHASLVVKFAGSSSRAGGGSSPSSESPLLIRGRPEWKLVMGTLTQVSVYIRELEHLINIEIERLVEQMALGRLERIEEYKHLAGRIAGLAQAKEYLGEADKICAEKYR